MGDNCQMFPTLGGQFDWLYTLLHRFSYTHVPHLTFASNCLANTRSVDEFPVADKPKSNSHHFHLEMPFKNLALYSCRLKALALPSC